MNVNQEPPHSVSDRELPYAQRQSTSFIIKVLLLGLVTVGLLIPLFMTLELVSEREGNARSVAQEISTKWGNKQTLISPVLAVPYTQAEVNGRDTTFSTQYIWLLPQRLNVTGKVDVEIRKRSIYRVPVYTTDLKISGEWDLSTLAESSPVSIKALNFEKAEVVMGLSDLKGIKDYVSVQVEGEQLRLRPDKQRSVGDYYDYDRDEDNSSTLLRAPRPITYSPEGKLSFTCDLSISGSQALSIAPTGGETQIDLTSNWGDPSFGGFYLPETSEVNSSGFTAQWRVVDYNRGYGNVVRDQDSEVTSILRETSSIEFKQLINEYSQSNRSVKYGILIILLSFVSIFFIEMAMKSHGVNINIFHYLLVGLALVLFYTLLLSMSELIGFGLAYLIASLMTIGLISVFFRSLLPPGKHALILAGILSFLYLLVYLLIQMTTYALLAGSIGLFIILALVMYVSSRLIK